MFIPLHVKSDYSLGYGTASVDELVERVARLGFTAFALTDLENLYGQVRFHDRCRFSGVRPITGLELRPGFDGRREVGRKAGRINLLAMDRTGYGSLCRIVSRRRGAIRGPVREDPLRDPFSLVLRYRDGLFALSDDPSVVERLVQSGTFPLERMGMLLVRPDDPETDRRRREAAARLGVRVVADLDVVFPEAEDRALHQLQLAIRQGKKLSDVAVEAEGEERRLRSPAEAAALFADIPEAVAAAEEIADACHLDLLQAGAEARPARRDSGGAAEELRKMCWEAVKSLFPEEKLWTKTHRERLDRELAVFEQLGFSRFMLVVAEILTHCRTEGIPVVVRGSAVSSLALHLLGGSPVDPLAHGLLFERFLHEKKSAWPDVDVDLPWHSRDQVIEWVFERFGRDRVAMVSAHHTFRYRSALREGLKAWGATAALIGRLIRNLPPEDLAVEDVDFLGLAEGVDEAVIAAETLRAGGSLGEILALTGRLVGRPHHVGAHPGGMVVAEEALVDALPLELAPKGVVITQYDLVAVARLGLVKIDLLGNRCLSEIEEALLLAGHPAPVRLQRIPPEDPQTLELIDRADTVGCFQLESPAMRSLLVRLPVRRQSDVTAALALIRPGPAAGEAKMVFIRRSRGEEESEAKFPAMAERLKETHGLFLYEEDIMLLLSGVGRITLEEADELRKAIVDSGGDKALLASLEEGFLTRALAAGTEEAAARQAWTTASRFAAYSFNKAHAASYAVLAYYSAYTKRHFPLQFACALLNHHQGLYPLRTEAAELARRGIPLRPPHVNASEYHSVCTGGEQPAGVRVGLDKVKRLFAGAAADLLEKRMEGGPFRSLGELLGRVRLNGREITALVLSGACDGLSPLAVNDYPFAHESVLELLRQKCQLAELDRLSFPRPLRPSDPKVQLYKGLVRARNELRYLDMHLTAHPAALLRPEGDRLGCLTIAAAVAASAGPQLRLMVLVAAMRRALTRQGPMLFLTLEDETGLLEAALLPPAYRRIGDVITTPGPFLVEGALRRQQGAVHLEVTAISPFRVRERPFGL